MKFRLSRLVVVLALACASCSDSVQGLVERTRRAGTAEEWRAWAAQVIERGKTNSAPLPRSEWPEFVRRTTADNRIWQVLVDHTDTNTSSPPLVMLVALGGFESIGVIIGPPAYVEVAPPQYPQISREVYPGIYVREVH